MEQDNEDRLQQECYMWFHNTFPEQRGLLCYNLNNSRNKVAGAINRSMGLQAGRADLTYYTPSGRAVFIEMKTPTGTQQPEQKKYQKKVESFGYLYKICRTFDEFKVLILTIQDNEKQD
jgi:hypothetical protein